jgi:hypothetical protein
MLAVSLRGPRLSPTAAQVTVVDGHLMSPELSRFHSILNSDPVVPEIVYRRNKVIYELVCYVNCLIGCVFSGRRDVMPIFSSLPPVHGRPYFAGTRELLFGRPQLFDRGRACI